MTQKYFTAAEIVFGVEELFEQILRHLSLRDLFIAERVSRTFREYIRRSLVLRRIMFLVAAPTGTIVPLRVRDTPLRRINVPRSKFIWCKRPVIHPSLLELHVIGSHSDRPPTEEYERLCANKEVERPVLNPFMKYWEINRKLDTIQLKQSPVSHADRALRLVPHTIDKSICDSRRDMLITQPPVVDVVIGRSDTQWGIYEAHNENGVTIGDVLDAEERFYNPERRFQETSARGWT